MKKNQKKLLGLCMALLFSVCAHAQTDITQSYLNNPSFEADASLCNNASTSKIINTGDGLRGWNISPLGWQATNPSVALLITKDCFTDNNFGKTEIQDGNYAYYQRYGWGSAASELKQSSKQALPAGEYELSFFCKTYCANNAATSASIRIVDNNNTSLTHLSFNSDPGNSNILTASSWKKHTLRFILKQESSITLKAEMVWGNGGSCILYDHFSLLTLPTGSINPDQPNIVGGKETDISSPTEGVITHDFVAEQQMKNDLLQMLANSLPYAKKIWENCSAPNDKNEACGFFKGNSAGQNNEDGVRTNADFSMICAFMYKYAQGKVSLPTGITWEHVKEMAIKSLVFGYSTHKANKFKVTSNNAYWGSVSTSDYTWESSLWAMSLAYASHFLSNDLSNTQKDYIYNMIKAECNYELQRTIPTGYNGDTKSEENGWEADVLACALGLYPNDKLAPQWFDRLRQFAINSYSQADDASDNTIIDPEYDNKTIKDLYKGKNLYDDYTLQNHNYFHTSYQNVVMQELGEAHLALQMFQGSNPKWKTNALMHNNQKVMNEVLCHLALADGELAMPNGNDWSMFLYDQIASYATAACFLRDPNALMLENVAYKYIKARQTTTLDGSWLLHSDIGPRRMGVQGHRIMMTYLMHDLASTSELTPTTWNEFSKKYEAAKLFTSQNIVRANTKDRFTIFSWSNGLKSYTGYIAANTPDKNKIISPYKANNTGNFLGWYTVSGKATDATPLVSGIYNLMGNSYTMNGKLLTNSGSLENNFTLYSTPGNAVIYMDYVIGKTAGTITKEQGGLMAISTDPFTKEKRTLYYNKGRYQSDGTQLHEFESNWVNIDNQLGIVSGAANKKMAFGDRALSNSVYLSKIYPLYSTTSRTFNPAEVVDRRHLIYYSNVDSAITSLLSHQTISLTDSVPTGWNGVIASDPDKARYLILSNYQGDLSCTLKHISMPEGAPVFTVPTIITKNTSTATFRCDVNHSIANTLRVYLSGAELVATQVPGDSCSVYLYNTQKENQEAQVNIFCNNNKLSASVPVKAESCVWVEVKDNDIHYTTIKMEEGREDFKDITARFLKNPSFEEDQTYGTQSQVTLNGIIYNPCYINTITATSSKWPQILPIKGWQAGNLLESGSNFSILYSMPYNTSMYCVSPSSVGNSASIMAAPALNENAGNRCLSILNSWDKGSNSISQKVILPAGQYKISFIAQYVLPNEMRHTSSDCITSTGDNVNYSLCGIKFGNTSIFRFPRNANTWENIDCEFTLIDSTEVTVSLGLKNTASVGAAHITRLYIDDVRLLRKGEAITDGMHGLSPLSSSKLVNIYNTQGVLIRKSIKPESNLSNLPQGIYIIGNKKVFINK